MPSSIGVNLRVTGHSSQGGRKYMEDFFSVAYQQSEDEKNLEYAFFGIYDGHGGSEAAIFAKEHLMNLIVSQKLFWSDNDDDILRAIREGYIATHYAMWQEQEKWPKTAAGLPSTAGTTASVAFIRRGKIYVGHVGDSGIVLGYQDENDDNWKAQPLTQDHKPECNIEMERIKNSGGKVVTKCGVPRVVWNRPRLGHKGPVRRSTPIDEIPFLAVARSLGDLWSYNSKLNEFVVSPDPDVHVIKIDPKRCRCLIFGTDGLWNVLTSTAAVEIVRYAELMNDRNAFTDGPREWTNPSKRLVDKALEKWSVTRMRADNTSVVTIMLDPPGPPKRDVLKSCPNAYSLDYVPYIQQADQDRKASMFEHGAKELMSLDSIPMPTNGVAVMTRYEHPSGAYEEEKIETIVEQNASTSMNGCETDLNFMKSFAESYNSLLNTSYESDHSYTYHQSSTSSSLHDNHHHMLHSNEDHLLESLVVMDNIDDSYSLTKLETRSEQMNSAARAAHVSTFGVECSPQQYSQHQHHHHEQQQQIHNLPTVDEYNPVQTNNIYPIESTIAAMSACVEHDYVGREQFNNITSSYPHENELIASYEQQRLQLLQQHSQPDNIEVVNVAASTSYDSVINDSCHNVTELSMFNDDDGDNVDELKNDPNSITIVDTGDVMIPLEEDDVDEVEEEVVEEYLMTADNFTILDETIQINEISSSDSCGVNALLDDSSNEKSECNNNTDDVLLPVMEIDGNSNSSNSNSNDSNDGTCIINETPQTFIINNNNNDIDIENDDVTKLNNVIRKSQRCSIKKIIQEELLMVDTTKMAAAVVAARVTRSQDILLNQNNLIINKKEHQKTRLNKINNKSIKKPQLSSVVATSSPSSSSSSSTTITRSNLKKRILNTFGLNKKKNDLLISNNNNNDNKCKLINISKIVTENMNTINLVTTTATSTTSIKTRAASSSSSTPLNNCNNRTLRSKNTLITNNNNTNGNTNKKTILNHPLTVKMLQHLSKTSKTNSDVGTLTDLPSLTNGKKILNKKTLITTSSTAAAVAASTTVELPRKSMINDGGTIVAGGGSASSSSSSWLMHRTNSSNLSNNTNTRLYRNNNNNNNNTNTNINIINTRNNNKRLANSVSNNDNNVTSGNNGSNNNSNSSSGLKNKIKYMSKCLSSKNRIWCPGKTAMQTRNRVQKRLSH